jgi:transposase-like protein
MEDLSHFCCQNTGCSMYGVRNSNTLTVSKIYGKSEDIRLLRCSICKARFSERRGTPYFNSRMPKAEVTGILHHLQEGNGIRRTARLTKHNKDTVSRYTALGGEHALLLHKELVAISP